MSPFKIGYCQYAVIYKNTKANLAYIEQQMSENECDLLVLPELFTTGYSFDDPVEIIPYVEILDSSKTVQFLQSLCLKYGGAITGTIPELYGEKIYNTAILVDKTGLVGMQRKIHLTEYEKHIFTAGSSLDVFTFKGVKIGLMSCFDAWFAPLSSKLKLMGAQILCSSSCFGGEVTPKIMPVRAIENQCFVINCNRVGVEEFDGVEVSFIGNSQIIDPDGNCLAEANQDEVMTVVEVDLDRVDNPDFGSQICKNFEREHHRYAIDL